MSLKEPVKNTAVKHGVVFTAARNLNASRYQPGTN